ncbi:aspartyl-tRNA(Asn)/glutamyl-tRNA(Gln) amidotransferase subunit C [Virgibacillus natechei]|uniref:Aspartyl/glutamyl-tRNA(Asn/Gln) amidotransferase subunit C n=1 Tax=Virgibacillus natechei TaxID=1216297 RepID=A0ABS4IHK0_9BACI|nr:Asp-tRNA(Asn)/Glu-tRNA(Gln) amidotransferase subunit GatC [Virgibacillus natechei]MBP1970411.1 aspartyl-tRNA(Asn)/glutamyl-tRNA(Gln) amidotransferase subunit C [Virgibacillus natechei]UZD13933.1 Asp-tRNA(Asn)/Glu-tRNA(Gln) amidotransferase subunit GatC [Virgibacillus natechei]
MTDITKDQVKHVAHLARLAVSEEEAEKLTKELGAIMDFSDQLSELDTEGIEPTVHDQHVLNVLRKDKPKQWDKKEEALKNAPDKEAGQFRVPSILE